MSNTMITFAEPFWLVAGAVAVLLLIFVFRSMEQKRKSELARFASSHLLSKLCANVSGQRRGIKKTMLLLAIFCCFVSLARPQYGSRWVDVKRKGIDILFAIDTSKSMLAEDVRPNRLQRAKYGILDFVEQLEGDRVGLMPFAGSAFLLCPLTIDYQAFESSLAVVDASIIPKGGTDLAAAIQEASAILSNDANHKILVMITDGENLEGDAIVAASEAAEKGMTIYTVGVGTSGGELVPFVQNGKTGFVKDASGKFITSRLDEEGLTKIAETSSGLYVPLGSGGEGLQTIYREKLSFIPKEELAEKRYKVPIERFVWSLGVAIALLGLEFLATGRKSKRSLRIPFIKTAGRRKQKSAAMLLFCWLLLSSHNARASAGEEFYGTGDFLGASEFYSEKLEELPGDALLNYNYGTAAYKNNMFEDAAKSFAEALKSDDLLLQERAYYNRGVALFQQGQGSVQTDKQHAVELWRQAVKSFDGALQLNSTNEDAGYNQILVKKKLEELKKEQQKEQEEQDQEENKQEGDQQEQDSGDKQDQEKKKDESNEQSRDQKKNQEENKQKEGNKNQQLGEKQEQSDSKQADQGEKNEDQETDSDDASKQGQAEATAKEQQEEATRQARINDEKRREQGKMTSEEAMQLLNSLKDETGELNFVPASLTGQGDTRQTTKDW